MSKTGKRRQTHKDPRSISPGMERYLDLLSQTDQLKLAQALQKPLPQAIRANPLKVQPLVAVQEWADRYGWQIEPVAFCPAGWQVLGSLVRPSKTIEYKLGYYFIQDAASMLPVELFSDEAIGKAPLVLDLAAAPGGKTTHLASRMADRGLVIANDSSASRMPALQGVLQDWGALNAAVANYPGERFGGWYPEAFDLALLDAPCSMENLSGSSHLGRRISAHERDRLADRQFRLLESGLKAVKTGGEIVYSTCTLAPEEDEAVIDRLLSEYPGVVEVGPVQERLPLPAPALKEAYGHHYNAALEMAIRLWPYIYSTSGFFAARLRKLDNLPGMESTPPGRNMFLAGAARLAGQDAAEAMAYIFDGYGFDLASLLDSLPASLWRMGTYLWMIPGLYLDHFQDLPVASVGMLVAQEVEGRWVPSHEFTARFGMHFQRGRMTLAASQADGWMKGSDVPAGNYSTGEPIGKVVAVFDEANRLLGRGKLGRERLRNMLPRRLLSM